MRDWYSRPVFFVKDAEDSLKFYTEKLGFSLDWNYQEGGRADVCQVSRHGFELILAQNATRAGSGRVFISLNHEQEKALRKDIEDWSIDARETQWGIPVVETMDPDGNELLFAPPRANNSDENDYSSSSAAASRPE